MIATLLTILAITSAPVQEKQVLFEIETKCYRLTQGSLPIAGPVTVEALETGKDGPSVVALTGFEESKLNHSPGLKPLSRPVIRVLNNSKATLLTNTNFTAQISAVW